MSPQAEYWRDRLMKAHGWVIAAELLVVGWLVAPGDTLNLFSPDGVSGSGANPRHDAIGFPRRAATRFIFLKACVVYAVIVFASFG